MFRLAVPVIGSSGQACPSSLSEAVAVCRVSGEAFLE
jgi:hypothetical protein